MCACIDRPQQPHCSCILPVWKEPCHSHTRVVHAGSQQKPADSALLAPPLRVSDSGDWLNMRASIALQDLPLPPKLAIEEAARASRSPLAPQAGSPTQSQEPAVPNRAWRGLKTSSRASDANWLDPRQSAAFTGLDQPPKMAVEDSFAGVQCSSSNASHPADEDPPHSSSPPAARQLLTSSMLESSAATADIMLNASHSPRSVKTTAVCEASPDKGAAMAVPSSVPSRGLAAAAADDVTPEKSLSSHAIAITPGSSQSNPHSAAKLQVTPLSLILDRSDGSTVSQAAARQSCPLETHQEPQVCLVTHIVKCARAAAG